jgi:hypothetical protein
MFLFLFLVFVVYVQDVLMNYVFICILSVCCLCAGCSDLLHSTDCASLALRSSKFVFLSLVRINGIMADKERLT